MSDEREMEMRLFRAELWQQNHDKLCAARWGILIKLIGWGGALAMTTIIGIGGWSLNRLYDGQQQQNAALQQLIGHR